MLVLLPPSETKAAGGNGAPLDLGALTAADALTGLRTELVEALVKLADDVPACRSALDLSPAQDDEIARNAALWTAPTMPAPLRRSTTRRPTAARTGARTGRQSVRRPPSPGSADPAESR